MAVVTTATTPPTSHSAIQWLRLHQIQHQRKQIQLIRAAVLGHGSGNCAGTLADRSIATDLLRRVMETSSMVPVPRSGSVHSIVPNVGLPRPVATPEESMNVVPTMIVPRSNVAMRPELSSLTLSSTVHSSARPIKHTSARAPSPKKKPHKKKAVDKPRRALSAYNFFFRDERQRILGDTASSSDSANETECSGGNRRRKPHGKIGFENLARIIARRWQDVGPDQIQHFKSLAEADKVRYEAEMDAYVAKHRRLVVDSDGDDNDGSTSLE